MARVGRDVGKEHFWRRILLRRQQSKQSTHDFCAENGISEASFYAWRRIIAERDQQALPARRRKSEADGPAVFIPLHVSPTSCNSMLEVMVGSGRVVRVPADFDAAVLRRLLAVLEDASSC